MTRTTLDLDPGVLSELKRLGAREGKSIGQLASELLAVAFAGSADVHPPDFMWTTAALGQPLFDLRDGEAVRGALDPQRHTVGPRDRRA